MGATLVVKKKCNWFTTYQNVVPKEISSDITKR